MERFNSSGYIAAWKGRYLTTNLLNATTNPPLGATSRVREFPVLSPNLPFLATPADTRHKPYNTARRGGAMVSRSNISVTIPPNLAEAPTQMGLRHTGDRLAPSERD